MEDTLYVELAPQDIVRIIRIFEACEYLALVSTIDKDRAIVRLRGTADTMPDVQEIVAHLPFPSRVIPASELQ